MADDQKIEFGSLWTHTSEKGAKYMSGAVKQETLDAAIALLKAGGRLLVLSNKQRPGKNDPSARLYVVPKQGDR